MTVSHPPWSRCPSRRSLRTIFRLDFSRAFYLDRIVPAVANGAPGSATGQSTQNGAVAFTTTHWSVVLAAQGESTEADAALDKLCRTYWWPLTGSSDAKATSQRKRKIYSSFFRAAARTERSRNCEAGKGAFAFLSAGVAQKFSLQGATSRDDRQTRRRPAFDFAGGFARARTRRPGAGPQIERGSHLRTSLGINIIGASACASGAEYEPLANCHYSIV